MQIWKTAGKRYHVSAELLASEFAFTSTVSSVTGAATMQLGQCGVGWVELNTWESLNHVPINPVNSYFLAARLRMASRPPVTVQRSTPRAHIFQDPSGK